MSYSYTKSFQIIGLEDLSKFLPNLRLYAIPKFQSLIKRNAMLVFIPFPQSVLDERIILGFNRLFFLISSTRPHPPQLRVPLAEVRGLTPNSSSVYATEDIFLEGYSLNCNINSRHLLCQNNFFLKDAVIINKIGEFSCLLGLFISSSLGARTCLYVKTMITLGRIL